MNENFENNRPSRVLRWSIIIALVIVLNLFFNYAITLVYPAPQYENFCPTSQVATPPADQKSCLAAGGQWTQTVSPAPTIGGKTTPQTAGYCDVTFTCQKNFDAAGNTYARTVFIVLVLLGVASIVVGAVFKASDVISAGLSLGGVLSLIIASARYWTEAANILKVLILAVALIALIWLGVKKFKN